MKKLIVKCFDEKETRLAKDLNNLGLKTHAAIMIVYLQKVKETNSKDMKERTDLPYPNISLAGKELLDNKWISVRKQKKTGRFGRPSKGLPKNNLSKLVTFWTNCIIPFWM